MGKFRETLVEGELHLGPERDRVFADLSIKEKDRFKADIHAMNILLQGLPKDIYILINHYKDAKEIWDNLYAYLKQHEEHANENKIMLERYNQHAIDPLDFNQATVQNGRVVVQNVQGRQNRGKGNYARGAVAARNGGAQNRVGNTNPGGQTNTFDDDVDEAPVQDLALNKDNVFQADQCDTFDSDVDEAPTTKTMFMANLSSADPIYDEAGLSYDSDILSEVQDYDNYIDSVGEYHEYVKYNAVQVVKSNVSYVPNDALMMIINDMHEQSAQRVSANEQNKVVNESLTAKLARYKEQVKLYEKGQELLKKKLHSVRMQLNSTINHNKLIKEEVTTLKKDFKQKENKYLEEFLDMKQLKEKVEDKLYKQDQSLQTVHMLCKSKHFYDEKKKVALGYKNLLYLTKAKQVQPALYNGHEFVKTTHAPACVHDSEDTLI
ncbi:hypothetical protein Tco_0874556 [Tanacetum coccineum]|uniref:Integrase, catalytic region, zinc finger, CCHC-type, peptidase aspartic, catalytic n=1 Tax=Tanacetum coccineum TaxID=301880 RepID=A0ABQ5BLX6_9ASTR